MAFRPLIAVCGTTGVGKSNLAIEIALSLSATKDKTSWTGARIINADAMQVYAGMDILTNKVPLAERQGIEHLLMGFKSPTEQYVVGEWVRDALKAVEEAHSQKQVPIVVGGTSYWIQHLLFPDRLVRDLTSVTGSGTQADDRSSSSSPVPMSDDMRKAIATLPPDLLDLFNSLPDPAPSADADPEAAYALYNLLKALDASVAERWHWKDTRKVLRSLRIIQDTGRRPSEMIEQQSANRVKPRFNTLCFWVYAKPEILKPRLDSRVDKMVEQGLLDEVRALQNLTASSPEGSGGSDYTFGMFQSIGYRELHCYLTLPNPSDLDFQNALNKMKISTRQYAKTQISWLRNKLLPALYNSNMDCDEDKSHTYLLDATELGDKWDTNVRQPATEISQSFLHGDLLPDPLSLSEAASTILRINQKATDPKEVLKARRKVQCDLCTVDPDQPFMVEAGKEWELHLKTRVHRRRAYKNQSSFSHFHNHKSKPRDSGSDSESLESEVSLSTDMLGS
ncbi:tRNA isopentenyltransferase [Marasmius fiardii PR-910]|nr:tRNA isopentenyltransferase [Marasmius fiardii PR-910]